MKKLFSIISLSILACFILLITLHTPRASAIVNGSAWKAGRIIDDPIFTDKNSMSADEIQVFLNSKVPTCDTMGTQPISVGSSTTRAQWAAANGKQAPPYTCLKNYYEVPKTNPGIGIPANNYGGQPVPQGARSAAQLIWDAAQRYSISPKVLLTTIQKESAGPLTVDDWPFQSQYTYAMGAHCPDGPTGAQCDPNYAGFSIQISESAALFRYYLDNMNQPWWPYKKPFQVNSILWNVSSTGCGAGDVYIESMATAALYTYTPYQPNKAALNNMYGTGDGCSAYGNRNFWRIYIDWFGSPYSNDTLSAHPDGTLIEMNYAIFLVDNGVRRHIRTPSIFDSYRYKWAEVKRATIGDRDLPEGMPVDVIHPGTLFRTPNSSVYVTAWDNANSTWSKQLVTYAAFTDLGYKWDEVQVIPDGELPVPTYPSVLTPLQHPSETLIRAQNDSRVFMLDSGTRRYVSRPEVLYSYHYWWSDIKLATTQDNQLPVGADLPYREASILYDGANLYLTNLPPVGDKSKRPIAPWECFADRFSYNLSQALSIPVDALPPTNGPVINC